MGFSTDYREAFNLPQHRYFLSHSVGCLPKVSEQALQDQYLAPWKKQGGDAWPQWLGVIQQFHNALGKLLNSNGQQFCAQVNLSSALTKLLTGLKKTSSRTKVVLHEDAFPSIGFVVQACEQIGLECVIIAREHSPLESSTWQAVLDDTTLACILTHVHSNTGLRSNIETLTDLCRNQGVFSIVDIAQSVGIIPINLQHWDADAVIGSCVKWLCGGPGAGFLWLNASHINSLEPMDVGWFSHRDPFEFDIQTFEYADSALRFLGGTPSVAPYAIAAASIEYLANTGIDIVLAHNRMLVSELLDCIHQQIQAWPVLEQRGGTLCLQFDNQSITQVAENMRAANMQFDLRGHVIRVSFHLYNTIDDAQALAKCIESAPARIAL